MSTITQAEFPLVSLRVQQQEYNYTSRIPLGILMRTTAGVGLQADSQLLSA